MTFSIADKTLKKKKITYIILTDTTAKGNDKNKNNQNKSSSST